MQRTCLGCCCQHCLRILSGAPFCHQSSAGAEVLLALAQFLSVVITLLLLGAAGLAAVSIIAGKQSTWLYYTNNANTPYTIQCAFSRQCCIFAILLNCNLSPASLALSVLVLRAPLQDGLALVLR